MKSHHHPSGNHPIRLGVVYRGGSQCFARCQWFEAEILAEEMPSGCCHPGRQSRFLGQSRASTVGEGDATAMGCP